MNTYQRVNYRKIYEQYHGPIPKESNGRSYEIHHKDGDHTNNDPKNLIAVTLQEHYDIHYAQGDYGACYMMASQRMNRTPEEIAHIASLQQQARVAAGTHHLSGGEIQRRLVTEGKHPLQGSTHNLNRIKNGNHPSQIKKTCPHCGKTTSTNTYARWHGDKCKLLKSV